MIGVVLSKNFILTTLPKNRFCLLGPIFGLNSTAWKLFSEPFSITFINKVPKPTQKNKVAKIQKLEQCDIWKRNLLKGNRWKIAPFFVQIRSDLFSN